MDDTVHPFYLGKPPLSAACQPTRASGKNPGIHRAIAAVCAFEITAAHQKFAGDFRAGEGKGFLEQLDPCGFVRACLRVQPGVETAVCRLQLADDAGVVDGGYYFAAVTDDAGVCEQAGDVGLTVGGNARNIEMVRRAMSASP